MRKPSPGVWAQTWAFLILPFLGFWAYGLTDLDEGFYGAVVREMNRRGEWITPYYNGLPWYEKPVLLYWAAKPSLTLFGEAIGPRLPSVLASLALIALTLRFSARLRNPAVGQRAALILASSALFVAPGRMMLVDPLLNLCVAGGFFAFFDSLENPNRRWIAGLCLGLGALAKGPVAFILFFGALAIFAFWERRKGEALDLRGGWLGFAAAASVAVASWYVPAYLASPKQFVQKFLIEQNLNRFVGDDSAHNIGIVGLPLFILVVLVGMVPYSWFAAKTRPSDRFERFLASWAIWVIAFFTLSGTKLPHYVLPATVPVAILAAIRLTPEDQREPLPILKLWRYALGALIVFALCQVGFNYMYANDNAELHRIARFVKAQGGDVAAYQMPRREKDLGTLKPELKETSHPSLPFVLDRVVIEAESLDALERRGADLWILTRPNRISDEEVKEAKRKGFSLKVVPVEGAERHYVLYRLEPPTASSRLSR